MSSNEMKVIQSISSCVIGISSRLEILTNDVIEMKDDLNETKAEIQLIKDKVSKKPEYMSVGEAAFRLGLSERTIRDRIKEGKIPAFKNKGERSYQIPTKGFYEVMEQVKSLKFTRTIC